MGSFFVEMKFPSILEEKAVSVPSSETVSLKVFVNSHDSFFRVEHACHMVTVVKPQTKEVLLGHF